MKVLSVLVFSAYLIGIGTPATAQVSHSERLSCEFSNYYFRVTDGVHRWEKFVAASGAATKVECGKKVAAVMIGPYLITFGNGTFNEKFVGSFSSQDCQLVVKANMVAASMGPYFLVARDGNAIQEKFIGSYSTTPLIKVAKNVAVSFFGYSFLASDGTQILDHFVSSTSQPLVVATKNIGAALVGPYLVGFSGGQIIEKFISASRSSKDSLVAGKGLIGASVTPYFLILDGHRNAIIETFLNSNEKVQMVNGIPVLDSPYSNPKSYNSASGQFEEVR